MTMQPFSLDRIGFTSLGCWRGGEDGDGGDLFGVAPLRTTRSFLDPYTGSLDGDLREMAVERTTPEDLCAAMEEIERMGLDEERLDQLLNGDEDDDVPPARASAPTTSNGLEVRVNGQLLADFLAEKPNTTRIVPLSLRGRRPQGGKRRRRRGRRGHGNGHSGNGRR